MGIVVPKMRKHLCADALLRSVQDVFCQIPEHRKGDAKIPLHDALMSAFAMFSLKAPSLLAFDKEGALGDSYTHRESLYNRESTIHHPIGKDALWAVLQRLSR